MLTTNQYWILILGIWLVLVECQRTNVNCGRRPRKFCIDCRTVGQCVSRNDLPPSVPFPFRTFQCPEGQVCFEGNCTPDTTQCIDVTANSERYCPEPNGTYRNPNNCHSHIQCTDGQATIVSCNGAYFDTNSGRCRTPPAQARFCVGRTNICSQNRFGRGVAGTAQEMIYMECGQRNVPIAFYICPNNRKFNETSQCCQS